MNRSPESKTPVLDVVGGLPETTPEDLRALRRAAATRLGPERAFRLQQALSKAISQEQLAQRPITDGEPFRL